jgi:hypothetical protein
VLDPGLKRTAARADAVHTMKLPVLVLVIALPLLLALGNGRHALGRSDVSRTLLAQMNGSSAGHITKSVGCNRVAAPSKSTHQARYACVLEGSRASERAFVTVTGNTWRAEWAPLRG